MAAERNPAYDAPSIERVSFRTEDSVAEKFRTLLTTCAKRTIFYRTPA